MSDPITGTANATVELVKSGVLGAIFVFVTVPLAVYTRHLSKLLKEANDARAGAEQTRASDAKAVVDKMLQLNDKWNGALSDHSHVLSTLNETLKDNKDAMKEVRDLILDSERRLMEADRRAVEDRRLRGGR